MPGPQLFDGAEPILFGGSFRTSPGLPKPMRQRGDVLLFGRVGGMLPPSALMFPLCLQVSLVGVFQSLPGAFVSGQVIFFSVVLGAGPMGVSGEVVVLGGYLLRFAHTVANARIVPSCRTRRAKACRLHNLPASAHFAYSVQPLHPESAACASKHGAFPFWAIPCKGYWAIRHAKECGNEDGIERDGRVPRDP
jgi:hypothetical protein